jgi:hypothetical protein
MIRFTCPACRKVYKAGDDLAGRKMACKQCAAILLVPEPVVQEVLYGVSLPPDDVVEPAEVDDYPRPSRRRRRRSGLVDAVAIMYVVTGLLNFACAAVMLAGGAWIANLAGDEPVAGAVVGGIAVVLATICVLLGIPDVIAAHGIRKRRHWGYVLALVLSGINGLWALASILWGDVCSLFLCGTCSIFAFVVLLNPRYAAEFA